MSNEEVAPDLGIMLYEDAPEGFEDEFLASVAAPGLSLRSHRLSKGPFAGIELYLPFAAMIYVAARYFEGFLTKAGEEHYDLLSGAAKKLWRRARRIKVTPIGSRGKVSARPKYSMCYSIIGEAQAQLSFKLIFLLDASEADGDEGIDAFFRMIRDLHEGTLADEDLAALLTYQPIGGTALVTYDGTAKRIVPVNGLER